MELPQVLKDQVNLKLKLAIHTSPNQMVEALIYNKMKWEPIASSTVKTQANCGYLHDAIRTKYVIEESVGGELCRYWVMEETLPSC
jgi:hypothetical protein